MTQCHQNFHETGMHNKEANKRNIKGSAQIRKGLAGMKKGTRLCFRAFTSQSHTVVVMAIQRQRKKATANLKAITPIILSNLLSLVIFSYASPAAAAVPMDSCCSASISWTIRSISASGILTFSPPARTTTNSIDLAPLSTTSSKA